MLSLYGPEGEPDHVLSCHVCKACAKRGAPCLTPNFADSDLIDTAPDMFDVLTEVDEILTGMNWHTDRGVLSRVKAVLAQATRHKP